MAKKRELKNQAVEIIAKAAEKGLQTNYFFQTTFERYMTQLDILEKLKKSIKENGPTVTKEYVKKRPNIVVNPAITEYNKTSTAANNTVATLMNIIKTLPEQDKDKGESLNDILKGMMADD